MATTNIHSKHVLIACARPYFGHSSSSGGRTDRRILHSPSIHDLGKRQPGEVVGILHVHTNVSHDGGGTLEGAIKAARDAISTSSLSPSITLPSILAIEALRLMSWSCPAKKSALRMDTSWCWRRPRLA